MCHVIICYHRPIKGTIFEKKNVITQIMYGVILSNNFVYNISHSNQNWTRSDQICKLVFMYSTSYSGHMLVKLEFSYQTVEKYTKIKFENPCRGK